MTYVSYEQGRPPLSIVIPPTIDRVQRQTIGPTPATIDGTIELSIASSDRTSVPRLQLSTEISMIPDTGLGGRNTSNYRFYIDSYRAIFKVYAPRERPRALYWSMSESWT
jgi:hypothetical protein